MRQIIPYSLSVICLLFCAKAFAQEFPTTDENGDIVISPYIHYMKFASKYMGPNGLPVPDAIEPLVSDHIELETRTSFHYNIDDQTKDFYFRLGFPVIKKKVAIELSKVMVEHFSMSDQLMSVRKIVNGQNSGYAVGDIYVTTLFQVVRGKRFPDLLLRASLKTASGNYRANSRYTDAPGYFFDAVFGKEFKLNNSIINSAGLHFSAGFYCWQTYDDMHPQEDAPMGTLGGYVNSGKLTLRANTGGYWGYINNGDRPLVANVSLEYGKNRITCKAAYQKGLHDYIYSTYSFSLYFLINAIKLPNGDE